MGRAAEITSDAKQVISGAINSGNDAPSQVNYLPKTVARTKASPQQTLRESILRDVGSEQLEDRMEVELKHMLGSNWPGPAKGGAGGAKDSTQDHNAHTYRHVKEAITNKLVCYLQRPGLKVTYCSHGLGKKNRKAKEKAMSTSTSNNLTRVLLFTLIVVSQVVHQRVPDQDRMQKAKMGSNIVICLREREHYHVKFARQNLFR